MERKTFVKLQVGESASLTVSKISKQEVVNIESEDGKQMTLYAEGAKARLRELWAADRANPHGPLVGKRLKFSRHDKGTSIELVSSQSVEEPTDEDVPF